MRAGRQAAPARCSNVGCRCLRARQAAHLALADWAVAVAAGGAEEAVAHCEEAWGEGRAPAACSGSCLLARASKQQVWIQEPHSFLRGHAPVPWHQWHSPSPDPVHVSHTSRLRLCKVGAQEAVVRRPQVAITVVHASC